MKRSRELLAFLLGAILATVLTILIGRGQDPGFARAISPSTAEPALNQTLDNVQIDDMTLEQALVVLSDKAHVPIKIKNRKTLESQGVDFRRKVALHVPQVTLASALRQILEQFNAQNADLAFRPDENSVTIGSTADSAVVRVYDVGNLNLQSPPADSDSTNNQQGQFLYARGYSVQEDSLIDIMLQYVAPDSWRDKGGAVGSHGFIGSKMIIMQTWQNQQIISSLLSDLGPTPTGRFINKPTEPPLPSRLWVWHGDQNRFEPVTDSVAEAALRHELREVDIRQRTLEDALSLLGEQAHVAVLANWRFLEGIGLDRKALVTLRVREIALTSALKQVLTEGTEQVGFKPEGYSVSIDSVSNSMSTRVYDLGAYFDALPDDATNGRARGNLLKTIKSTIDPGGWDESYSLGRISVLGSKLVIRQTWENHEAIQSLLQDLMRKSTTQPTTQSASR
jgi:hypothetical protein